MSNTARRVRRRETRIKQRCREREDIFISDYVRHKYPGIYDEAVTVYKLLNKHYPDKADVRKTPEHKAWKITGTANQHPAFNIRQRQTVVIQLPNPEPPAIPEPPNPEPPSPEPTRPEPTSPEPTRPEPPSPEPTRPEPPSPEPTRPEPPSPEPTRPEPPSPEPTRPEPPSPEPTRPEPPSPEPTRPEPPSPEQKGKIPYTDGMQLIIPLLKPPVKHPGLITETLEIITEEVVGGDEQPTSLEQIDPKIMDQLITELRADPELGTIMADIEQQLELEELDMDIDIDMDTRLEDELNWEFW